jgi:hypothetical protein
MSPAEVAAVAEELKSAPPPATLEEVRARKKSITEANRETRKSSIAFIRARTASRAAAQGIPIPDNVLKGHDALGTFMPEKPPKDELDTFVPADSSKAQDPLGNSGSETGSMDQV